MAQQKIRVAINGFGRIGRLAFRLMFGSDGYEVVAVNNRTFDPAMLTHLLKYDSVQGRYALADKTAVDGDCMVIDGKRVKFYSETDATKLPWKELNVDVVLECTGSLTSMEKASAHITAGAKKVILSAPAKDAMPTVVYNVNHKTLKPADTVISAASCTTNCLAPMAKALNDLCGIEKGIMTTIHAYTGDQNPLDAAHKNGDLRRARSCAINIVPNTTGAAKAIGLVIPELNGKLDGAAQRVPVATGSLTELTAVINKPATKDQINAHMKSVSTESFGYTDEQLVSSDIIGSSYGSLFDATQTKVMTMGDKALVKVVAWYDNEMGYTHQMVRTIKYFMELK